MIESDNIHKKITIKIAIELLWGIYGFTNIEIFSDIYDGKNHKWILTLDILNSYNQSDYRRRYSVEICSINDSKIFMSGNIDRIKFTYQKNQWSDPIKILEDSVMGINDYKHSSQVFNHIKNITERIMKFLINQNIYK